MTEIAPPIDKPAESTTAAAKPKPRRRRKKGAPAFGELCEAITGEFGGPQELARVFKHAYDKCKPGSQAQVAMAQKICDLILRNSQIYGDKRDLEQVSDADLENMLAEMAGIQR